jgi:hypothetical protein
MKLQLLQEPHKFKVGDNVIVKERNFTDNEQYSGKIVQILELSPNEHFKEYKYITVPYFYVKFPKEIYSIILKRGWNILYKNKIEIVGDINKNSSNFINKIYIQRAFSPESEIDLEYINGILIWREGWIIEST